MGNVTLAAIMELVGGSGRAGWSWGRVVGRRFGGWQRDYRTVQASGRRTAPVLPLSGSQVASLA